MSHKILIIITIALAGSAFALEFPDTVSLKKEFKVLERIDGLPVEFRSRGGGKPRTLTVSWKKGKIIQTLYRQKRSFSHRQFSDVASLYGRGAVWHELAVKEAEKSKLRKEFPGFEQQWILKGYGGESGWMGSGLFDNLFYLVFREMGLGKPEKVSGPLDLHPDFISRMKTSVDWLASPCADPDPQINCHTLSKDRRIKIRLDTVGQPVLELWLEENNPIDEIQNALAGLSPAQYHEYSRDLADLAAMESQNALAKILGEIPALLTWPSWQLQDLTSARLKASDFMEVFKKRGTDWPFIPVFSYRGPAAAIDIRLHFTGSYQLRVHRL